MLASCLLHRVNMVLCYFIPQFITTITKNRLGYYYHPDQTLRISNKFRPNPFRQIGEPYPLLSVGSKVTRTQLYYNATTRPKSRIRRSTFIYSNPSAHSYNITDNRPIDTNY